MRGRGYQEVVDFWVVRGLGIAVLFGEPWLRKWNPAINWETREMRFSDGVIWKAQKGSGTRGKEQATRGSHLNRGRRIVMGIEKTGAENGDGVVAEDVGPEWLGEFKDVFYGNRRVCRMSIMSSTGS